MNRAPWLPTLRHGVGWVPVCVLLWLGCVTATFATIKEIDATGRYALGDNDTRIDGHRLALMDAKRNALEKAGTYVESVTEVKDFQLTRDDIHTYTAGLIEVTETEEPKWEMVGQTQRVTVSVRARVDTDVVTKRIATLRQDKEATKQLREEHAKQKENERKVAALNQKLRKAKKGSKQAEEARASRDNALAGVDAATLRAQAVAAKSFSKEEWEAMRGWVNRNVDVRGCMPFKTAQAGGSGLLAVGAPAVALVLCRPRRGARHRTGPADDAADRRSAQDDRVRKEIL